MGLQDEVDAIVAGAFTNADAMMGVESVTYASFGGDTQTINVNVMRNTPVYQNGVAFRELRIFVARSDVATVDSGGDVVTIAHRYGETPRDHRVVEIIKEDAGGYLLRLE